MPADAKSNLLQFYKEKAQKAEWAARGFLAITVGSVVIGAVIYAFLAPFLASFDEALLQRERLGAKQEIYQETQKEQLERLEGLVENPRQFRVRSLSEVRLGFHSGQVLAVAMSADGSRIASGGRDGTVRLWDREGTALKVLRGHEGLVWAIAMSADGSRIASGGNDGTVRLWDREGTALEELRGHEGRVRAVAMSADGSQIASGGEDGTVRLWSRESTAVKVLRGHEGQVRAVAMSADGSQIASGGFDGTVRLWDREGTALKVLRGHEGLVWAVAMSADGSQIASGGNDGTVRLWDRERGLIQSLYELGGSVASIATTIDGGTIAYGAGSSIPLIETNEADALVRFNRADDKKLLEGIDGLLEFLGTPQPNTTLTELHTSLTQIRSIWVQAKTKIDELEAEKPSLIGVESGETKVSGGSDNQRSPWEDRAFVSTQATRIGVVVLLMFLVQIFLSNYRYNVRVASFHWARYNALLVAEEVPLSVAELSQLADALSPDAVDFGRTSQPGPSQQLVQIASRLTGGGRP